MKAEKTGKKHKVLIVEDSKAWSSIIRRGLGDKASVLCAYDLIEGARIFMENQDIALVVMDACVPGDEPNAQLLVREIRKTFNGPIIAMSSLEKFRKVLLASGCDYEVEEKSQVTEKVFELLGIS